MAWRAMGGLTNKTLFYKKKHKQKTKIEKMEIKKPGTIKKSEIQKWRPKKAENHLIYYNIIK